MEFENKEEKNDNQDNPCSPSTHHLVFFCMEHGFSLFFDSYCIKSLSPDKKDGFITLYYVLPHFKSICVLQGAQHYNMNKK